MNGPGPCDTAVRHTGCGSGGGVHGGGVPGAWCVADTVRILVVHRGMGPGASIPWF